MSAEPTAPPDSLLDPVDELALATALGAPDTVEAAWAAWLAATRFDEVGPGSYFLLPLMAHRLAQCDVDPGHAQGRLRGVARRQWYESQQRLQQVGPVIEGLRAASIEVCVLGDLAMAAHWYPGIATRPVRSIQVLVREPALDRALDVLSPLGWAAQSARPDRHRRRNASSVDIGNGTATIRLRWHAFDDCRWPGADDALWSRAEPHRIEQLDVLGPDPVDTLLWVLAHARNGDGPVAAWVCDAHQVASVAAVDLDVLADRIGERRLDVRVRTPYDQLRRWRPDLFGELGAVGPASRWEQRHLAWAGPTPRTRAAPANLAASYGRYLRSVPGRPGISAGHLLGYLRSKLALHWRLVRRR